MNDLDKIYPRYVEGITYNLNDLHNADVRPQVPHLKDRPPHGVVSDLIVMQSNAGYYIGRYTFDIVMNRWCPYSRDSIEYYPDEVSAKKALDNEDYTLRDYI
jgi:hypothetical protein